MHRTGLVGLTALFMLACNSPSDVDTRARLERDATVQDVTHDVHSPDHDAAVPDSTMPDSTMLDSTVPDTAAPDSPPDTTDGSRRDAGPSGPFDAAVCALPEEPGDPPPDCIAPCIWTVMKTCRVSKCCVVQSVGAYTRKCDRQGVLDISATLAGLTARPSTRPTVRAATALLPKAYRAAQAAA